MCIRDRWYQRRVHGEFNKIANQDSSIAPNTALSQPTFFFPQQNSMSNKDLNRKNTIGGPTLDESPPETPPTKTQPQPRKDSFLSGGPSHTSDDDGDSITFGAAYIDVLAKYRVNDTTIFQKLAPKEKYSEAKQCCVCQESFGMLSKKSNCKFCGGMVCKDCSKKKRADPENKAVYHRICDNCEEKYLNQMIFVDLDKKKTEKERKLNELRKELHVYQTQIKQSNASINNFKEKTDRRNKEFNLQIENIRQQTELTREETTILEKENTQYDKILGELGDNLQKLEDELTAKEEDFKTSQVLFSFDTFSSMNVQEEGT
eukprot:TRINITY_DN12856_c0_g1_i14.p1 TRINITY_DN12856_c0_g1~~TRINITY_DN12856_c0_g1_i14.p1  ORF type:complete len:345 (-),score=99.83 TRINITY_DN12856_c0_g1_i14:1178-2128(-)